MYVCLCRAVTDSDIHDKVVNGDCSSLRDVGERLGVGTGCGKCGKHAKTVIQEALRSRTSAEVEHWKP